MKKNWLIMLAIAMMGSFVVACSSDNNTDEVVTPPSTNTEKPTTGTKVVLTGSFGARSSALDASRGTRAVDSQGKVTWQSTDKFSLSYYSNTIGDYTKVEVGLDSILNDHDAFFTVTLDDPDLDKDMTFIYPYSAANDKGTSYNESALLNNQKGTLADVSANWDIAMATVKATYFPTESVVRHATLDNIHLDNQLCILEMGLKLNSSNAKGNKLTIKDGDHTYVIVPTGLTSKFVVALIPVVSHNFEFTVNTNKTNLKYEYYGKDLPAISDTETAALGKFVTADGKVWTRVGEEPVVYFRKSNGATLERNKYYKFDLTIHNDAVISPIGVIAWLGNDAELSCGKNHGLVMSVNDDITEKPWTQEGYGDEEFDTSFGSGNVESISDCQTKYKNGETYCDLILTDHGHNHIAFDELQDLRTDKPVTIAGANNWFIPSAAQWLAVLGANGVGQFAGSWSWDDAYSTGSSSVVTNLNNVFSETYTVYEGRTYWTSTQANEDDAVYVNFSSSEGVKIYTQEKYKYKNTVVRPFFAF